MKEEYSENKRYKNTKKVFEENFDEIEKLIEKSTYKNTGKALFRFAQKIDKISIFISQSNDLYISRILLRSLLEHEIVAYYIWTKYINDENDECGTHYYIDYFVHEQLKRERYNLRIEGIEKGIKNNDNTENLKAKLPFLNDATEQDIQRVHAVANQFEIKKNAEYLNSENHKISSFSDINKKVILDALIKYNILSSYIHGGTSSELDIFEKLNDGDKEKALKSVKNFGMIGARFIMEQLIMFLADEHPKYVELIKQVTSYK